jgi:hypothetical protein
MLHLLEYWIAEYHPKFSQDDIPEIKRAWLHRLFIQKDIFNIHREKLKVQSKRGSVAVVCTQQFFFPTFFCVIFM